MLSQSNQLFKDRFDFSNTIPYHHDVNQVLSNLCASIVSKQRIEDKLYTLFDYPGMGKTTTIFHAAMRTNSLYIQVPLSTSSLIDSIEKHVIESVPQFSPFSENFLLGIIENACKSAIVRIFGVVLSNLQNDVNQNVFIVKDNGLPQLNSYDEELGSIIEKIMNLSGGKPIVLHFDECQKWKTSQSFKREVNKDANVLSKQDIKNFYMISMSKTLVKLPRTILVALSGTNVSIEHTIRIDSSVKTFVHPALPYSTAEDLLIILKHFCNIDLKDEYLLAELTRIEGSFRIFFYFLHFLYESYKDASKEVLTIQTVRDLIEKSYLYWKGTDLFAQISSNSLCLETSLREVLFCALYPQLFGGDTVLYNPKHNQIREVNEEDEKFDGEYFVSRFQRLHFPEKWMKYQDIGLVRWKAFETYFIMEKPFHFLNRLWCEAVAKDNFSYLYLELLRGQLIAGTTNLGNKGYAFQFSVALELTLPYSPLFQKIVPKNCSPILGESYQLKAFSYEELEQLNIGPFIYYASDRDQAVPDVDIVTFVLNENKEPKKIYIQVKRDKNRSRCSNALKSLFEKKVDVAVFISWHHYNLERFSNNTTKLVIEGPNSFSGTVIPFQTLFKDETFKNYQTIVDELNQHSFFRNYLFSGSEPNYISKKRKYLTADQESCYASQSIFEISKEQPIASTSYATHPALGKQTASHSKQEPFDLSSWIANKLGLNIAREHHKQRLEELVDAFDRAGYRTREIVNTIDDEAISDINSKLPEDRKLEGGEKRALKRIAQ
jgi:uncharacterized protein